jgi:cyclophilin family peptidyl-prolyl cis-trans isomerase
MASMFTTPGRSITALLARLIATRSGRAPAMAPFESLEARQLLANSPLPTIGDLESPNNTVVRIETNYGDFDIELFNSAAPITVANFLNYVTSGRYDETFFHRSAFNPDNSPFVLQGGGFAFDDTAGLTTVQTDAAIVRELTGRQNDARTVAMARTNALNTATSQFFINYVDNDFLNPDSQGNGGYAVFGRIVNGWSVVQTIQALAHPDLTGQARFAGPEASNFGTVPVNNSFNSGVGVREQDLVTIVNAEIIKPASTAGFFTQTIAYPEGFRSAQSVETITLKNNNNQAASYQVIVHYETGLRDVVIASGSIAGNSSLNIAISDFAQAGLNLVRSDTPYSIEVQSAFPEAVTDPQPISATSTRVDFNGATSEDFYNPAAAPAGTFPMRTWDLPRIERNALSREFITYQNLSDAPGTITFTFRHATGTSTVTRIVEPYRRGGVEVGLLNLPLGAMSVRMTSTVDIVVNASDWDLPQGEISPTTAYTPAFGVLGLEGGGSTTGGLAFAKAQNGFSNTISIANMGTSSASVTLRFWPSNTTNSTAITRTLLVPANNRNDFSITPADLGVTDNTTFSVTYASTAPVSVQYTSFDSTGRNIASGKKADGYATTFQRNVAPVEYFAGQLDPTNNGQSEVVSIFNPFSDTDVSFTATVRYVFSDGTVIDGSTVTMGANGRAEVATRSLAAVLAKISSGNQFRNYGIQVFGTAVNSSNSATTQTAGVVSVTRMDTTNGRAVLSRGLSSAQGLALNDPVFA